MGVFGGLLDGVGGWICFGWGSEAAMFPQERDFQAIDGVFMAFGLFWRRPLLRCSGHLFKFAFGQAAGWTSERILSGCFSFIRP